MTRFIHLISAWRFLAVALLTFSGTVPVSSTAYADATKTSQAAGSISSVNATQTQADHRDAKSVPVHGSCKFLPTQNPAPLFQNLNSVNLYIDYPSDLRRALECQGHEEECAQQNKDPLYPSGPQVAQMKALSEGFPQSLKPDTLTDILRPAIQNEYDGVLARDKSCHAPAPTVLDPFSGANYGRTIDASDVLNVTVTIRLIKDTTPRIVVLSTTIFRHGQQNFLASLPYITAIPLDLSQDESERLLRQYVDLLARMKPFPRANAQQ